MTNRQEKAVLVRKIAPENDLHIRFMARGTTCPFDLLVTLDLGLDKEKGGFVQLKQIAAILALGREEAHLPSKGAPQGKFQAMFMTGWAACLI